MTRYEIVEHLPDLIHPEEYEEDRSGERVRIRIVFTDAGIEILGDSMRAKQLERLFEELGSDVVQQMLCG